MIETKSSSSKSELTHSSLHGYSRSLWNVLTQFASPKATRSSGALFAGYALRRPVPEEGIVAAEDRPTILRANKVPERRASAKCALADS